MSLSSGILKRHKKKFTLDEDGLRRIEAVLKKAIESHNEPLVLYYRVEREDSRFYETYNLEDVLTDANVVGKKIELLLIYLRNEKSEKGQDKERVVMIAFDKENEPSFIKRDVTIRISSENRTWALMLADELESQILRLLKVKNIKSTILFLVFALLAIATYNITKYVSEVGTSFPKIITQTVLMTFMVGALAHILFKLTPLPKWLLNYCSGQSVFLWGEEESEHSDRVRVQRNIYWGVIVAFIVSIISGIVLTAYDNTYF